MLLKVHVYDSEYFGSEAAFLVKSLFTLSQFMSDIRRLVPTITKIRRVQGARPPPLMSLIGLGVCRGIFLCLLKAKF